MDWSDISGKFSSAADYVADSIKGASPTLNKVLDVVDPGKARLQVANLLKGGKRTQGNEESKVMFVGETGDWRVKVSLAQSADYFYKGSNPGIMSPLSVTDGVIFPYTPQVSVTHAARYGSQNLTHSNYTNYFYEGSEVQAITISGDFTVQTVEEGLYLLAAVYFFRATTKMWFGAGSHVGHPPPMVFLSGYGSHYFPNVPCVITSFQHTLPQDVDYIAVPTGVNNIQQDDARPGPGNASSIMTTRVPTSSSISVSLQPIYSRKNLYDNFSLDDFAAGKLIKGKGGYI